MKMTYRKNVGQITRKEKGVTEANMGDSMQIVNAVFDKILRDPSFLAQGVTKALARKQKAKAKKAKKK